MIIFNIGDTVKGVNTGFKYILTQNLTFKTITIKHSTFLLVENNRFINLENISYLKRADKCIK